MAVLWGGVFNSEAMLGERVSCWLGNWDSNEKEALDRRVPIGNDGLTQVEEDDCVGAAAFCCRTGGWKPDLTLRIRLTSPHSSR